MVLISVSGCFCAGPREIEFVRGGPAVVEHQLETVVSLGNRVTAPSSSCLSGGVCASSTNFTRVEITQVRASFDSADFEVLSAGLTGPVSAEVRWIAHAVGTGILQVTLTDKAGAEFTDSLPIEALVPAPLVAVPDCKDGADDPLVLQLGATRRVSTYVLLPGDNTRLVRVAEGSGFDAGEPVEILPSPTTPWVDLRARTSGNSTLTLLNVPGGLPLVVFDEATPGRVVLTAARATDGWQMNVGATFDGARACTGLNARHEVTTTPPGLCVPTLPPDGGFESFGVLGSACTVTVRTPWGTDSIDLDRPDAGP